MTYIFSKLTHPIVGNKGEQKEGQDEESQEQSEWGLEMRGVKMKTMIVMMDFGDDPFF